MIVTDPCLYTLHARGSMYEIYAQLKMCANMFACKSKGKCNCKSNYLIPCNDVSKVSDLHISCYNNEVSPCIVAAQLKIY